MYGIQIKQGANEYKIPSLLVREGRGCDEDGPEENFWTKSGGGCTFLKINIKIGKKF